jgi:hypothetical protein
MNKQSTGFNRWRSWKKTTWPYELFIQHHTQLNQFYWSHAAATVYLSREMRAIPDTSSTKQVFSLPPDDQRRIPVTVGEWGEHYKELNNWVRLCCVVALCSNLEVYLRSVISLSLESDPGTLLGASHAVDGVVLLKKDPSYSYTEDAKLATSGSWSSRIAAFRRFFRNVPPELEAARAELDQLRIFRNGVSHTFGRDAGEYLEHLTMQTKPLKRVSEARLKSWMGLVLKVVKAVDAHLLQQHIGAYETLLYFHQLSNTSWRTPERETVKKNIGKMHHETPSKKYFDSLIAHYRRA